MSQPPSNRPYPYNLAQSGLILESLLAVASLDEISTAEPNLGALERYLVHQGRVDESSSSRVLGNGVVFWVYPTGGKGPFELLPDGRTLKHGLLLTVEKGATVESVLQSVREKMPERGIEHVHVPSSGTMEDEE